MIPTPQASINGLITEVEEEEKLISQKAIEIARGMELQMAMKSAIELGILDTISEADKRGVHLSASEVAAKIPGCVNPNAPAFVDCMLSLLASFSVLKCEFRSKINGGEGEEKVYGVAPVCKYFLTNKVDGSMAPLLCMRYDKVIYDIWNHLNDAIIEGGTAFEKARGMKLFEYAQKDPRLNKVFNDAMSDYTIIIMKKILDLYGGLEEISVLVDVGGGIGASLSLITSKYPNIRGINFDLPHVVADAPKYPGVEHVGGDMFEKVPHGDAMFLKKGEADSESCLEGDEKASACAGVVESGCKETISEIPWEDNEKSVRILIRGRRNRKQTIRMPISLLKRPYNSQPFKAVCSRVVRGSETPNSIAVSSTGDSVA